MDPAVTLLLATLSDDTVSRSKKLSGVRDQIDTLRNDLRDCKSILKTWTETPIRESERKDLVRQLKDAVYDAEDILADFVADETKYKIKNFIRKIASSSSDRHATTLLAAAKKIESMKQVMAEMHARMNFGNDDKQDGLGGSAAPKSTVVPMVEEENVVGFDEEEKTVIELLTKGSSDLEVITLVGMPGLGKTTLATMVYRNSEIVSKFYNRVWIYVSQDCNVREVFIQILGHFTEVTSEKYDMTVDELSEEVYRNLEREKYLIILDDVWALKDWDALRKAFPKNKKNSRILITSRNEKVAKHANPHREPHRLKFLNLEESFKLLSIKALGSEGCPDDLEALGVQIAKGCMGLPLAIVVMGGILREKGTESSGWRDISDNVEGYIGLHREQNMDELIARSFYQLPYPLKPCFLYFGMFPEDFHISARKLVRLWIAEGFIEQIQGKDMSLEKIAEEYLKDLASRNLVIIGKLRSNGKIKTCHVHDVIREFCIKVGADENLYHEIKQHNPNPEFQNYRRICIHSRVSNFLTSEQLTFPSLRSFSCSSSEEINLHPDQNLSFIPKAFKLLRVLDGKPITFPQFPRDLAHLVHLKYLVLSIKSKILPEIISDLRNMQTLIIFTSSRTLEIKGDTWKMFKLRHLETNASMSWEALSKESKKTEELVKSEYLTTLSTISPETCTEDAFKRVPNINKLGIRGQLAKILNRKDKSCSFDNLATLNSLENLKLINQVLDDSVPEVKLLQLPQTFPTNLKKLTLENTLFNWSEMCILGKLTELEVLKLNNNAFRGEWWDTKDGDFPVLKVLHIERSDLVSWQAYDHQFPSLRRLTLQHCASLQEVPLTLAKISSLHTVELLWTTISAVTSAKKIQDQIDNKGFKLSFHPPDHGNL